MKADLELGVFERLLILNLLPPEGDFTTLRIIRDLKRELSFSEEELAVLQFEQSESDIKWNREGGDIKKTVTFGDKAQALIRESLGRLSETKKATEAHLRIADLFLDEEE